MAYVGGKPLILSAIADNMSRKVRGLCLYRRNRKGKNSLEKSEVTHRCQALFSIVLNRSLNGKIKIRND